MAGNSDKKFKTSSTGSGKGRDRTGARRAPHVEGDTPDWVADKLKELYGEVVREPLPENLLTLLRQLDGKDAPKE